MGSCIRFNRCCCGWDIDASNFKGDNLELTNLINRRGTHQRSGQYWVPHFDIRVCGCRTCQCHGHVLRTRYTIVDALSKKRPMNVMYYRLAYKLDT